MKYTLFAFLLFLFTGVNAQLKNTSWQGVFYVPFPLNCSFSFSEDSVVLTALENGEVLEIMKYKEDGDTLRVTKVSGGSPCSMEEEAVYLYVRDGDKLKMTAVKDDCDDRKNAFPPSLDIMKP